MHFTQVLPGKTLSGALNFSDVRGCPSLSFGGGGSPGGAPPLTPYKINVFRQQSCPARPRRGGRATRRVGLLKVLDIVVK
jgi:hypothetical protein